MVDIFEKLVFLKESPSRDNLVIKFIEKVGINKVSREALEYIYSKVRHVLLKMLCVVLEG